MRTVAIAIVGVFCCFLLGCAGGSRGSGGQLFDGSVSDASGRALPGVTVTILQSGDSAVTDQNGLFEVETDDLSGTVQFLLESQNFSGTAEANDIPADAVRIQVNFRISAGEQPQIDVHVEVKERHPEPTARPTPAHSSSSSSSAEAGGGGASSDGDGQTSSGGGSSDDGGGANSSSSGGFGGSEGQGGGGSSSSSSSGSGSTPGGSGKPTPTATSTPAGGIPDGTVVDQEGAITRISSTEVVINGSVFVPAPATEYKGKNGAPATLQDFSAGETAKARGRASNGALILERLEAR